MRLIFGIVLLLLGVGLLSCRLEGLSADLPTPAGEITWVRTVDGWERPLNWLPSRCEPPALHPLVLAAGQALFSVLALAAAAGSRDHSPRCR